MGLKAVGPGFADTITAATKFLAPDGTALVPSIGWSSDDDGTGTGLFRFGANRVAVTVNGLAIAEFTTNPSLSFSSGSVVAWNSGILGAGLDTGIYRGAANSVVFGIGSAVTTTARTEINKAVTAFTNAAAKATFTVTVPNAAHSAALEVRVIGSLGAGGAIGANEATATNTYVIGIARTAGVATVATATAAFGAVAVAVAGAATVTATAAVSAISGAVGATQTFTIDVTITRSTGSSDNHTCLCYAKLLNANVTGITIA